MCACVMSIALLGIQISWLIAKPRFQWFIVKLSIVVKKKHSGGGGGGCLWFNPIILSINPYISFAR